MGTTLPLTVLLYVGGVDVQTPGITIPTGRDRGLLPFAAGPTIPSGAKTTGLVFWPRVIPWRI